MLVLAPAPLGLLDRWASDLGAARDAAARALAVSIAALAAAGLSATGHVGDPDPVQAISDELASFPAREVVLVAGPTLGSVEAREVRRRLDRPVRLLSPGSPPIADQPLDRLAAVLEDALEVAAHEQRQRGGPERPEADPVADAVADHRRALVGLELVGVMPEGVGPGELHVDEPVGRLPLLDPGAPAHGNAVETEPVLDQRSSPDLDRSRVRDPKVQPRRRDRLEVGGVGEQREGLRERQLDPLAALEDLLAAHPKRPTSSARSATVFDHASRSRARATPSRRSDNRAGSATSANAAASARTLGL